MSTGAPGGLGGEHKPEPTPRVLYRRFASETRTVEVTSTTPWTKSDSHSQSLTNAKEQFDKVLKWTSEESLLKSNIQKTAGNGGKEENTTKPVLKFGLNQDNPTIYKPDLPFSAEAQFGGRRLSLAQRDKVVGGAAMVFAEPILREASHQSERRKSEFDVGRSSLVSFLPSDIGRRSEPKIEEGKLPTNVFRQSNNDKINIETKENSSFARPQNSVISKDKTQSIDTSFLTQKSLFSGSENNLGREKDEIHSTHANPRSEKGSISHPEKTCEKDKVHSNVTNFQKADNVTLKAESKSILKGNGSSHLSGNIKPESKCEKDKVYSTPIATCSRIESLPYANSRIEENKVQSSSNAYSKPADPVQSETKEKVISRGGNTEITESKNNRDRVFTTPTKFHQSTDRTTFLSDSKNALQGGSFSSNIKNEENHKAQSSGLKSSSGPANQVTFQNMPESMKVASGGNYSLDKTKPSADKLQSPGIEAKTANSVTTSSAGASALLEGRSPLKSTTLEIIREKSVAPSKTPGIQATPKTEDEVSILPRFSANDKHDKPKTIGVSNSEETPVRAETSDKKNADSCYPATTLTPKVATTAPSSQPKSTDSLPISQTKSNNSVTIPNSKSHSSDHASQPRSNSPAPTLQSKPNISASATQPRSNNFGPALEPKSNNFDNTFQPRSNSPVPTLQTKSASATQSRSNNSGPILQPKSNSCPLSYQPRSNSPALELQTKPNNSASATQSRSNSFGPTPQPKSNSCPLSSHPRIANSAPTPQSDHITGISSKLEPPSGCEAVQARPVTRSKSDVGEGNRGRTATTTRKSCAERRCCGARQRPSEEAATPARAPARARSLSRVLPMGSSASLAPKNKSSWTTQRALEAEVQQLKRELQMHKAEELRLHREIHKLRSVLQQATSFGEETPGDPGDGALLVSLQESHGMAGAAGLSGGASKKQGVSGESSEPESIQVPRHEKDMRSRQLIKAAILDNDFLKNLARSQIRELVDCMYPQRVQMGSYVIREGESGSHLYVLADGEMEVLKEGTVLGRIVPGKAFGELAILYNCTRTASIRAVSDLQVWVLDRRAFQQIMMRTGMQRMEENIAFLRSVPLLREINEQTLARIADALEPEFYPAEEYIVRQGARGNTFYIISGGSVEVTQRGSHGEDVVLRTLERGEYFGEQALLHDDCRTASVRALPPGVDCLTLDRESFSALIGSLSELHHKDYAEDTRSQTSRTSFTNHCRKEEEAVGSIQLEDLRPLGTLGVGGFGCVRLVMAPSGASYALKSLNKRHVAATGQQEHVAAERDVLLAARSPFIVRLLRTFRDDANVYLLLEACLGGEVWALLRDHERLLDKEARFVAACVLEALEYLHARDIVYRDLKPENLVLDANGYVKLVDFGFCKRVPVGCKTWTFCGTPEYVAPEVILNRGHDRAVDYWALGVLIYELLTGAPPFAANDPMGTYNLILMGMDSAIMPKYLSRPATHLIRRLCRAAPSERIGYQRGGFREVKAHRWFQDLDWDALRAQTMIPPIKPQVAGPTDMSNFYPQTLDEELAPAELSHWDADF